MTTVSLNTIKEILTKENPIVKSRVYGANRVNKYKLINPIKVILLDGNVITIPKGFVWDLASVPKFVHSILSPDNDAEIAYLIHDYLYVHKIGTRKEADLEMYLWAKVTNSTSKWYAAKNIDNWLRYVAVRLFGWSVYNKKKK